MATFKNLKTKTYYAVACLYILGCLPLPLHAQFSTDSGTYLREVELMKPDYLAQVRQTCATGQMPAIKRKLDADKALRKFEAPLPAVDAYCLKVLSVSRAGHHMSDLYTNLALQAQGHIEFDSADMAKLLSNNEAWRTTEAVLRAANAGQNTYSAISGKPHDLPCPLALDAGATWADGNAKAALPVTLTQAEVDDIARQCYAPATTTITIQGTPMPAQKAGLMAGVWLAKQ